MSERATRPINQGAAKAADDDLYSKHAGDPRPNALYDEEGNRRPLDANDPDQAELRKEWMDAYKANGGKTEPVDTSGGQPDQAVFECGQQATVDPLILISPELDEGDEPESEPQKDTDEEPEEEPQNNPEVSQEDPGKDTESSDQA
jgi:hypothetical protein